MVSAWLDSPAPVLFLVLAAMLGGVPLLLYAFSFRLIRRERVLRYNGLVAPFFSGIAVLFALLTGFVANDIWERNREAGRAVLAERDGLLNLYYLLAALPRDLPAVRAAERHYIEVVVHDEWPRMGKGERSTKAGQALGTLLSEVASPAVANSAGGAVQDAMLNSVLKVRSARYDRLAISDDRSDDLKWISVLALALLTEVALALEHLESGRVQLTATLLFGLGAGAALGPVALHEHPFSGIHVVSAEPLAELIQVIASPALPAP